LNDGRLKNCIGKPYKRIWHKALRECFEIGWVNLLLWTDKPTQPI